MKELICQICETHFNSDIHNKKVCSDECEKIYKKNYMSDYYNKNKPNSYEDCLTNFENIINSGDPSVLCAKGFTLKSKMSAIATTRLLKKKWFELLEEYSKINELYSYVKDEFLKYYKDTGNASVQEFVTKHRVINQEVAKYFGNTNIKNDCGFSRKGLNSKNELITYFKDLVNKLGYVPTYSEFMQVSEMKIYQFVSLLSDDKTWESVVKNTVKDEMYEQYLLRVKEIKTESSKIAKASQPMMDESLIEKEFRRVFDSCFENYEAYPTRRLFNELSTLSDGTYRKRYKESWNKTVERYGYPINNNNPSEKLLLGMISELTGYKFIPQAKWDWLKGLKGKHLFCDGYFEELNLIVEFDGIQHRKPIHNRGGNERYKVQVTNDFIKDVYLKNHGFKLIRISSDDEWYKRDFVTNILIENDIQILTPTN